MSAGVSDSGFNANTCVFLFEVYITLTDEGLNAEPGYGLAPVALLFKYCDMLRDAGPTKWVYDELSSMNNMKVKFLEEVDGANYVAKQERNTQGKECVFVFAGFLKSCPLSSLEMSYWLTICMKTGIQLKYKQCEQSGFTLWRSGYRIAGIDASLCRRTQN